MLLVHLGYLHGLQLTDGNAWFRHTWLTVSRPPSLRARTFRVLVAAAAAARPVAGAVASAASLAGAAASALVTC